MQLNPISGDLLIQYIPTIVKTLVQIYPIPGDLLVQSIPTIVKILVQIYPIPGKKLAQLKPITEFILGMENPRGWDFIVNLLTHEWVW